MSDITFLGLGTMGFPMAKRLLSAGFSVKTTIHKNSKPALELQSLGAILYSSLEEAVVDSKFILTILPSDSQLEETLLRPSVFNAIKEEAVIIEMTTATPRCVKRIADLYKTKKVRVFDAPVSGGVQGAVEGNLTIMGGGDADLLEEIRFLLEVFSKKIYHVGSVGDGKGVKAINQLLVASNAVVAAEALRLALNIGLNLEKVFDVISASSGNSAVFSSKFKKMVTGDFSPSFKLSLLKKDLNIALSEGGKIPLPMANLAYQNYLMLGEECDQLDYSCIFSLFREATLHVEY